MIELFREWWPRVLMLVGVAVGFVGLSMFVGAVYVAFKGTPELADSRSKYRPGEVVTVHDTVVRVIQKPPVVIDAARGVTTVARAPDGSRVAPVAYVDTTKGGRDTVLVSEPFSDRLDTIAGGDTITAVFSHPPPLHSLVIRRGPDSVFTHTITVTSEIVREPSFIERVGYVALGAVIGGGVVFVADRVRSP